ncbi:hypothetical protein GNE88_14280, partial [Trichormus variabilis PNB]
MATHIIKNQSNLNWLYLHIAMFIIGFILIITRRPDAILNPQFWAEDGTIFYAQAYNDGILKSLFSPYAGYLHTVPRLTAAFSMFFSLKAAPLVFNVIAITIQILPVNFLISSRFSKLIPKLNHRIALSLLYLALPGCYEINANLTNAQWHLALLVFMAMIAQSLQLLLNLFDVILIFVGGLTGPFAIIMIPAILFFGIYKKKNNIRINKLFYTKFWVLTATAIIQILIIFTDKRGQERINGLDASFLSLDSVSTIAKILINHLFLISILGTKMTDHLVKNFPLYLYIIVGILALIVGTTIIVYVLMRSPLELRSFFVFAALIPFTVLLSEFPNINDFALVGFGGRYWFNLTLAFCVGILWFYCHISNKNKSNYILQIGTLIVLLLMLLGIVSDW